MKTTGAALIAMVLAAVGASGYRTVPPAQQRTCVAFSSGGQVTAGNSFGTPIGHGLEFRLTRGWFITAGPEGEPNADYLSIVSPPFRTAPHLVIGAGYGLTAKESAGLERPLRFVLTRAEHAAARKAIESEPAEKLLRTLDTLARGTIKLRITAFQIRQAAPVVGRSVLGGDGAPTDTFESIAFEGDACVATKSGGSPWQ